MIVLRVLANERVSAIGRPSPPTLVRVYLMSSFQHGLRWKFVRFDEPEKSVLSARARVQKVTHENGKKILTSGQTAAAAAVLFSGSRFPLPHPRPDARQSRNFRTRARGRRTRPRTMDVHPKPWTRYMYAAASEHLLPLRRQADQSLVLLFPSVYHNHYWYFNRDYSLNLFK